MPNLFAATGSPAWGNPDYPWMIGSTLAPYTLEGQVFADLLADEKPDAKVAMLVQDDDFGKAYEEGFTAAIEGTDIKVVKVEKYATGANEVSSQITSLAATDADAFFNGGTLLACPDALTKAQAANWTPITWISATCTSKTLMGIAGAARQRRAQHHQPQGPAEPRLRRGRGDDGATGRRWRSTSPRPISTTASSPTAGPRARCWSPCSRTRRPRPGWR